MGTFTEETYAQLERTELLLGRPALEKLADSRVAVFGIGGVGGYVVEALARSGVGCLDLVDSDKVAPSNLNRQIIATRRTLGMYKVDAARERIRDISPETVVHTHCCFYLPENAGDFDFTQYDYVVDAIDTVSGKIGIVMQAAEAGVPVISSMGAGNKLDPSGFRVSDIYSTKTDPLARVMRRELKKRGIRSLKVVWSEEMPLHVFASGEEETGRRIPGSAAFVPAAAGLVLAGEVVRDLTEGIRL